MKYFIILGCVIASTLAQRPGYAGFLPKGPQYADVHNNFRVNTTSAAPSSIAAPTQGGVARPDLSDRIGGVNTTTERLPQEASGNANLVQWLQQWPQGNKPFWLLNAEHLDKHRHPESIGNNANNVNTANTANNVNSASTANNVVVAVPNRNSFGNNAYTLEDFLAEIDKEEYEKFNKNTIQQLNPDYNSEFINSKNRNNHPQLNRNDEQPRQQRLYDNYDNIRQLRSGRRLFK